MFWSERYYPCVTSFLVTAILLIVASSSMFAFPVYRGFAKYTLMLVCILAIFQQRKEGCFWDNRRPYLWPWILGLMGSLIMIMIHGLSGYSMYLESILLAVLITLSIRQRINKDHFLLMLAMFNIIQSSIILVAISFNGLSTFILGVNKNILIISLTLTTSVILAEFVFGESHSKKYRVCYLSALIMAMLAIVLSEVRTAILGLLAIFPMIFFKQRQTKNITLLTFGCLLVAVVFAFYESGRIHQGLMDLQRYQDGNSNSSWGIRLELYSLSLRAFFEQPLWGWGAGSVQEVIRSGIAFGVPTFNAHHYHSDFFTLLASAGLLGMLFWWGVLLYLFKLSRNNYLGIALLVASLAMGLTDRVWFDNKPGLLALACLLTTLLFVYKQDDNR